MSECLHTVETHCFSQDGQHMVLDVRQSRVLGISFLEREILAAPQSLPLEMLPVLLGRRYPDAEIGRALVRLRKHKFVLPQPAAGQKGRPPHFSGITRLQLSVAQECNLRCRYCIVGQGSFGGRPQRMSAAVARQAADFLLREAGEARECTLGFSGGEPVLNWAVVREAVAYSHEQAARRGRQVRYFLKTNGTLLEEDKVAFIRKRRIDVLLSLDGPATVNDRLRPTSAGRGSHDSVVAGLARLVSKCPEQVFIRATVTRLSPPVSELLDYLNGFGARSVNLQRVIALSEDYALDPETRVRLKEEYTQLARRFLAGAPAYDLSAAQFIAGYMTDLCAGQQRRLAERAAGEYLVVAASGGLYPHPDLAETDGYRLGCVARGLDRDKLAWWRSCLDVDNRRVCRDCWARYICGGGCLAAAIKVQGTPDRPIETECELIRHVIQLAIWVHLTLRERHPQLFLHAFPERATD